MRVGISSVTVCPFVRALLMALIQNSVNSMKGCLLTLEAFGLGWLRAHLSLCSASYLQPLRAVQSGDNWISTGSSPLLPAWVSQPCPESWRQSEPVRWRPDCFVTFFSIIFPVNTGVRDRLIASETVGVSRNLVQWGSKCSAEHRRDNRMQALQHKDKTFGSFGELWGTHSAPCDSNRSRLGCVHPCSDAPGFLGLSAGGGSWNALQALKRPFHQPSHTRLFLKEVDGNQRDWMARVGLQVTVMVTHSSVSSPHVHPRRQEDVEWQPWSQHLNFARAPFRSQHPFEDLGLQALLSQAFYCNDQ